jgi:hypothetical protein
MGLAAITYGRQDITNIHFIGLQGKGIIAIIVINQSIAM